MDAGGRERGGNCIDTRDDQLSTGALYGKLVRLVVRLLAGWMYMYFDSNLLL